MNYQEHLEKAKNMRSQCIISFETKKKPDDKTEMKAAIVMSVNADDEAAFLKGLPEIMEDIKRSLLQSISDSEEKTSC